MDEDLVLALFAALPIIFGVSLVAFAQWVRGRGRPVRWPGVVCGNALVLLTLLSLCVLGGEIYYRFYYDTTDALDYSKISQRWFQRYYHENALGCRDNLEYARIRAPDKRRITFLGDSFTAGHGVKDVTNLFALRLRQEHPEWEIHVLARPGYDTGHELRELAACFTNNYQADQVVLVYCLNDISDLLPENYRAVERIYADVDRSGWLRRNSYFVNTVYNRLSVRSNPDLKRYYQLLQDGYRGPVWEEQQARLKALRNEVESHGGRLLVVTFPFFNAMGPGYEYQFAHDELGRCWQGLGVAHLDLLPAYQGIPPERLMVNRFDPHPNEYAHELAAKAIGVFLKQQMASGTNASINQSNRVETIHK